MADYQKEKYVLSLKLKICKYCIWLKDEMCVNVDSEKFDYYISNYETCDKYKEEKD